MSASDPSFDAAGSYGTFESSLRKVAIRIGGDGAEIRDLRRLSGGASQETWAFMIILAEGERRVILRRAPMSGGGHVHAAGMEIEAAVILLAAQYSVPVPHILHVLNDADGLGSGFVMAHLEGEALGNRIVRAAEFASVRPLLASQCGAILAHIHKIGRQPGLPPLQPRPVSDKLKDLRRIYDRSGSPRPVFELALRWLMDNAPGESVTDLVHGDFRNGNLMINNEGVCGVLDWELTHLGDGYEDLGWLCVNSWRFGEIDRPVGGFGMREELFAAYEAESGQQVDAARVHYWEVLGTLHWGLICDRSVESFRNGADRSPERPVIARRASETELDLLNLLAQRV